MATRRQFLGKIAKGVLVAGAVPVLQNCAAGLPSWRGRLDGASVVIPRGEAVSLEQAGGVLVVAAAGLPVPIVLRRLSSGSVLALSVICTHAGCETRVTPGGFQCPCHGSEYDESGEVTEGPASQALQRFAVEETAENYTVKVK